MIIMKGSSKKFEKFHLFWNLFYRLFLSVSFNLKKRDKIFIYLSSNINIQSKIGSYVLKFFSEKGDFYSYRLRDNKIE